MLSLRRRCFCFLFVRLPLVCRAIGASLFQVFGVVGLFAPRRLSKLWVTGVSLRRFAYFVGPGYTRRWCVCLLRVRDYRRSHLRTLVAVCA